MVEDDITYTAPSMTVLQYVSYHWSRTLALARTKTIADVFCLSSAIRGIGQI